MSAAVEAGLADLVDADVVTEVTQAVWASFVDADVELVPAGPFGADDVPDPVVGSVAISGPVAAVVRVVLPAAAATEVATRMLGLDGGVVERDDVHDATGEITNMVGGNLKAVLAGEHRLGLPSVTVGPPYPDPARSTVLAALWWGEHPLLVAVDALSTPQPPKDTP